MKKRIIDLCLIAKRTMIPTSIGSGTLTASSPTSRASAARLCVVRTCRLCLVSEMSYAMLIQRAANSWATRSVSAEHEGLVQKRQEQKYVCDLLNNLRV